MAQMILQRDSAAKVKRAVRRHLRLVRRSGDDNALAVAERIAKPLAGLEEAMTAAAKAVEAAEDAFDDWNQDDARLDQLVRRLHLRCREWDASHSGARTADIVFGGQAPSEIIYAPRHKEPELVAQMLVRARELPDAHPAVAILESLGRAAAAARDSQRAYVDAQQRVAEANAAVEIAKASVIRAYRDNFIDIERACGVELAEATFPTLRAPRKMREEDQELLGEVAAQLGGDAGE